MQVSHLLVAAAWLAPTPDGEHDSLPRHTLALALSKLLLFGKRHCSQESGLHAWWQRELGAPGDARWMHVKSFLQEVAHGREAHALADLIHVRIRIY